MHNFFFLTNRGYAVYLNLGTAVFKGNSSLCQDKYRVPEGLEIHTFFKLLFCFSPTKWNREYQICKNKLVLDLGLLFWHGWVDA